MRNPYFAMIVALAIIGLVMLSAQKQRERELESCLNTIDQSIPWEVTLDYYQRTQKGFSGRIWLTNDIFVGSSPFFCNLVKGKVTKAIVLDEEVYPNESSP